MATRWDAMHMAYPEWLHIGSQCGELMGYDEKNDGAIYRFEDGTSDLYTLDEVYKIMDARIADFRDGIEEALRTFSTADVVGFIYGLYQDAYIEEYEETALYGIADPDELFNDAGEYWWNWEEAENPLVQILDL